MLTLCYQPYAHRSYLHFASTGPASDSQCLTAPDGPLKGFLELKWVGREGAEGGGREGEPVGAVWQDLLHGRRVQFTAGTLGALKLGNPLVMRPSESDSTVRLSSSLCYSDHCSHAPQTDSRTVFKTTLFNL